MLFCICTVTQKLSWANDGAAGHSASANTVPQVRAIPLGPEPTSGPHTPVGHIRVNHAAPVLLTLQMPHHVTALVFPSLTAVCTMCVPTALHCMYLPPLTEWCLPPCPDSLSALLALLHYTALPPVVVTGWQAVKIGGERGKLDTGCCCWSDRGISSWAGSRWLNWAVLSWMFSSTPECQTHVKLNAVIINKDSWMNLFLGLSELRGRSKQLIKYSDISCGNSQWSIGIHSLPKFM